MKSSLPGLPVDVREEMLTKLSEIRFARRKAVASILAVWFLLFLVIALFVMSFWESDSVNEQSSKTGIIILIVILGIILSSWQTMNIRRLFKEKAITNILTHLLPDVKYNYYRKLTPSNVRGTRLFKKKAEQTVGEDFFKGSRGETEFKFSELTAKFKTIITVGNSYGSKDKLHKKLFKGLLIICRIDLPLNKSVRIYSKGCKNVSKNARMERVFTEHEEFNSKFEMFGYLGEDLVHVIHSRFLERLIDIQSVFKGDIYISLFPKSANVAIQTNANFFDPKLRKKIDMKQVERIYQEIVNCLMVVDVIDELNQTGSANRDYTKLEL